jgi:hypothetical protein
MAINAPIGKATATIKPEIAVSNRLGSTKLMAASLFYAALKLLK